MEGREKNPFPAFFSFHWREEVPELYEQIFRFAHRAFDFGGGGVAADGVVLQFANDDGQSFKMRADGVKEGVGMAEDEFDVLLFPVVPMFFQNGDFASGWSRAVVADATEETAVAEGAVGVLNVHLEELQQVVRIGGVAWEDP